MCFKIWGATGKTLRFAKGKKKKKKKKKKKSLDKNAVF
jgi:hypothetical protein